MSNSDVFQFAAQQSLSNRPSSSTAYAADAPRRDRAGGGGGDDDDDRRSVGTESTAVRRGGAGGAGGGGGGGGGGGAEPSFASANFQSILPEYRNRGQDAIKLAFQPMSFSSIRDLPTRLTHQDVEHALFDKAAANLHSEPAPTAARKMGYKNLFSQFEYLPDTYDLKKELDAQEAREAKEVRLRVGRGKEFVNTAVIEKPIGGADEYAQENSLFYNDSRLKNRHRWVSDPIERFEEEALRERRLKRELIIASGFKPGGLDSKVDDSIPTRILLPDVLRAVQAAVQRDWADVEIKTTEEQTSSCICVEFCSIDADDAVGVASYMNVFARTNAVSTRFKLRKNTMAWNQQADPATGSGGAGGSGDDDDDDGDDKLTLRFCFFPPWARGNDKLKFLKDVRAAAYEGDDER
jgi:hypothetical protein